VIVGIICTVVISIVAIYQTLAARALRQACASYETTLEKWRAANDAQRRALELWVLRFESLRAILPLHHQAAARGDARQCNALLAAAIAQANQIGASKLRIRAVVVQGTADELFCRVRAVNRRRPGSGDPMEDARAIARLMRGGAPEAQAAVRLGIAPARGAKLLALLGAHPKVQHRVSAGMSLDAAAPLLKLPAAEQVAKLAEIEKSGEKPTARAVTNKLREDSGKAPVETPTQKLNRAIEFIDKWIVSEGMTGGLMLTLKDLRAILRPQPNGAAQPAAAEFGA